MATVTDINITDKAKKKIGTLAKLNHLDFDLVYAITSFHWNFDGPEGDWVNDLAEDEEYKRRMEFIARELALPGKTLTKEEAANAVYERLKTGDPAAVTNGFIAGATNKNYCLVSEYASFHYLANATTTNLQTLDWRPAGLDTAQIIQQLFLKIFRGGSVERYNLGYLYCDLVIRLPYQQQPAATSNWTELFVQKVAEKRAEAKLSDLITILKEFCKGDKYFLQTILEALAYAGILKVESRPVAGIFIPDHRNELAPHFYSNEWTWPLRFWNQAGK